MAPQKEAGAKAERHTGCGLLGEQGLPGGAAGVMVVQQ